MAAPDSRAGFSSALLFDWNVALYAALVQCGSLVAFFAYAWVEKVWWIVLMVVTLVSLFGFVWFANRQQVAPFFYAVGG